LGVGDLFEVRVYQEDELTNEFRVSPDGTIDFPLVGRVEVLGLQPSEVADRVRDRLRDGGFFREPQVSVLVREYASKRISVVGAVERPGTFPVAPGMTVVQAISQAGGFTPLASRNDVVLTRRVEGELRRYPVAVDAVANGRQEDIPVLPGDIIYIRERVF
jgi:polysaccharide export outer membrane protein